MQVNPMLTATRPAQVKPGSLAIVHIENVNYVGLAVTNPKTKDNYIAVFGRSQKDPSWEVMISRPNSTVLCFSDYTLRLPCIAKDWMFAPPPLEGQSSQADPAVLGEKRRLYLVLFVPR